MIPLSKKERERRKPPPPWKLLDARSMDVRSIKRVGKGRPAKAVMVKKGT